MSTRHLSRRHWIQRTLGTGAALWLPALAQGAAGSWKIATFRADVTPPQGHPLCGGWITPVKSVADGLEAIGLVILGAGAPIVVCAVDWTGILNRAHVEWRTALAKAAGTTVERVAVQCVHQHDAPFVCLDTEKLLAAQRTGPHLRQRGLLPGLPGACSKRDSQGGGHREAVDARRHRGGQGGPHREQSPGRSGAGRAGAEDARQLVPGPRPDRAARRADRPDAQDRRLLQRRRKRSLPVTTTPRIR